MPRMTHVDVLCVLALTALWSPSAILQAKEPKLKAEEVVARHLASIGSPEARAAAKDRIVSGSAKVVFLQGSHGQLTGKSNVLSEGRKLRLAMNFSALEYPGEQLAYDGDTTTTGQIRPGERSLLSNFVYTYDVMLKEGLLTGTLSTAWPLLDYPARQARLDYSGVKKIDGRQVHEIRYKARKGGGDLQVTMDFDAETFRHVRTQYRLVQPAAMASAPAASSGQRDTIYTLVEKFDDFRGVEGLTLPHAYELDFTIEGQRNTVMTDWQVRVEQITQNQPLDPKLFVVQ